MNGVGRLGLFAPPRSARRYLTELLEHLAGGGHPPARDAADLDIVLLLAAEVISLGIGTPQAAWVCQADRTT
jgi:hypothetical protein